MKSTRALAALLISSLPAFPAHAELTLRGVLPDMEAQCGQPPPAPEVVAVGGCDVTSDDAEIFGPSPYLSSDDSPFTAGPFDYFYLDTMENGQLDTPGVTGAGGDVAYPGSSLDSVDADDGVINNNCASCFSWHTIYEDNTSLFTFDANVLGNLPTHVGVVWTDVGGSTPAGHYGQVVVQAYDATGALVSSNNASLGDGNGYSTTAEDRFFGFAFAGGIRTLKVYMPTNNDYELDHLQYGYDSSYAGSHGGVPVSLEEVVVEGCPGSITRTWTATDACAQVVSATQVITMLDLTDTDRDGLRDAVESNTRVFVSLEDTGTDPLDPDTDDDGRLDGPEVLRGTDPFDPNSYFDIGVRNDFDNDEESDIGVYDARQGTWYFVNSSAGYGAAALGSAGSRPVTGDFDGDGTADFGVFYPASGRWFINQSLLGLLTEENGPAGDYPVTGDYDGDGVADMAAYDEQDGMWSIYRSARGPVQIQFGFPGVRPVPGDFDFDGRDDICVYNPADGMWYISQSAAGFKVVQFGFPGTQPVVGDFDGDGRADISAYSPQTGRWFVNQSTDGFRMLLFGFKGTVPVTGDYDRDGLTDFGLYYAMRGQWFLLKSTEGYRGFKFGYKGTIPIGSMPVMYGTQKVKRLTR